MAMPLTPTPLQDASNVMPQRPDEVLLNRYRVLARRGTGGFGAVCTCWDTRLQRRVAIKRMPLVDGQDGMVASTVDEALGEARTACLLAHPNIVSVLDFEIEGAYAYLIMEYIDGLNLAELLARVEGGTLSGDECACVLASVGKALSFAHENGVLHLDIKPTNIMVDRRGTVKLADFGMATLSSAAGYGDARGGTVGYMPPEQIQGMLVDERADVFALAVVCWQALCGKDPFAAGSAADSLEKIFRGVPTKEMLTQLAPGLDLTTEDGLLRAFAPTASERTASIEELTDALLPELGDPAEGQESLRHLVDQSEEDETDETSWRDRHLPWSVRFPWLEEAFERGICGLATLFAIRLVLPHFPGATSDFALVGTLVAAVAAAVWPPLGSALTGAATVYALLTSHPTSESFPCALLFGAAFVAWWTSCGHEDRLSCAGLLLPSCLPFPGAGALASGFGLDPLQAFLTGGAGALLGSLWPTLVEKGFYAQAALPDLLTTLTSPSAWTLVAGGALAALVSSAIAMQGSVTSGIAGQSVGLAVLVAAECVAAGVENGGMWATPIWAHVALAVLLYALLCIATVLRGPLDRGQEGEEPYELS